MAGFTASERDAMGLAIAEQPPGRETVQPILEGLRALACELKERMVLGIGTESALALLETTRKLVRGACNRDEGAAPDADTALANGGMAAWQVRALTRHIDDHIDSKLCLSRLAESVRLSPSYLCRACRQTFQCSPMQYVMQRRLLAARHLLRHSRMPLSELALNCGFADQAHFTRVFRGATAETPLRWRRMWQASDAPGGSAGTLPRSGAQLAS